MMWMLSLPVNQLLKRRSFSSICWFSSCDNVSFIYRERLTNVSKELKTKSRLGECLCSSNA